MPRLILLRVRRAGKTTAVKKAREILSNGISGSCSHREFQNLDEFGGYLLCENCGHRKELESGQAGNYLLGGWPEHCGLTMRWVTNNEEASDG